MTQEKTALRPGLPAWTYRNDELARLEHERVIRPSWQFACHVNQVKSPGDYVTLDIGPDSVIVLRGKDGVLRGFANACRHRGARLLDGEGKCRGALTCPYHGWSYALDGRLAGVPAEQTFPGLDKSAHGLKPVELDSLLGLVFVRIAGEGPGLAEIWGDWVEELKPYRIEEMEAVGQPWIETWNCNWKVAVDNNLENYHVPVGHPGYHRMLDNDLGSKLNRYGVAYSKSVLRDKPSLNATERFYQKLAPEVMSDLPEPQRRSFFFATMSPNIGIDIYPDSMDLFQILPKDGRHCVMRYPVFARPDSRREAKLLRYLNMRINRQVTAEDRWLCQRVQAGMETHGYELGPLSAYEFCIRDQHDRLLAACPVAGLAEAPAAGELGAINQQMLAAARAAA